MSTALYRRYRPESFGDVIGQEHVTEPLQRALSTGRVNHAYLFSGPRGCGKTTSARILARCLNCERGPSPQPCGTCDSCVALARGGSGTVDVIEIDAASHGGVDDARDLRERASYGPAQSRYKVYIIDEAHMVTPQGFNALLKIVEEPPEHVKFVFATTEPDKVIGTIRSRTHHYPFRLVPPAKLQDYLASLCEAEGVDVEPGVLSFVIRAGGGSVRDSLSVLDQLIAGSAQQGLTYEGAAALLGFTDSELLDAVVTALGAGDAASAFVEVDRVIEAGMDPRRFVEDLLERLRDLIVVAAVPDGASAVLRGLPVDQLERMRSQATAFGPGALSRAADVVNAGLSQMTGATAPRLQLELIIARVLLPGAVGPQGYAARLDRLERRLDVSSSAPPSGAPTSTAAASPSQPPAPRPDTAASAATPPPAAAPMPSGGEVAPVPQAASEPEHTAEAPSEPEATSEPAAAPAQETASEPATGAMDLAAVRRAWPDIVSWLSRNKRITWTFVSEHAHVADFDGLTLTLDIATEGLADTFRRGAHAAFVQEGILEVLGLQTRVVGRAGPGPGAAADPNPRWVAPTSPASPSAPVSPTRPSPSGGPRPETASPPSPGTAAPEPGPTLSAARDETGAGAHAEPGRQAESGRQAEPGPGDDSRAPTPENPAELPGDAEAAAAISADDEEIDGAGEVGLAVVERILGGTVIEDRVD